MAAAFFYGTLMFVEVRAALLGRSPRTVPASLPGYARRRVALGSGVQLPVIRPLAAGRVPGLLVQGLEPADLSALDRFENVAGGWYRRIRCRVDTEAGPRQAFTYVAGPRLPEGAAGAWDPERFRAEELQRFLGRVFGAARPPSTWSR